MKNIILATTLLVAFSISSFAKEKNVDSRLFNDLSATFRNSPQIHWMTKDQYKQASFTFRNKTASAFYSLDHNDLIGFRIQLDKKDLPQVAADALKDKYSDWKVVDAITFIDASGYVNYYTQISKGKKTIIVRTTPAGKSSVYARL